jgi:peptidoglycan L-alanyl-D-glutamate endopeptidase CwlK
MDQVSLDRIKYLHPSVRQEVLDAFNHINSNLFGPRIRLRLAMTFRTLEEQAALYAQGRTKPGKKVTNAPAGQSIHNYGLAFDIVVLIDKDGDGKFETASWDTVKDADGDGVADWMEVVACFKKLGWSWGGDWKSFPDYPHFEKTFGHSWRSLLAQHQAGNTISETINGKPFRWAKLK